MTSTKRINYRTPTLQDAIYNLVHNGGLSISELADEMGCSESLLYKGASLNDSTNFPLKRLIPTMKRQGDFTPLFHIASRCDFLLVPQPKKRGRMRQEEIQELQQHQLNAVMALTKFFNGDTSQDDTRKAIETAMGSLARGRLAVNHGIKQEELNL